MAQVIIGGKIYTVYEMCPHFEESEYARILMSEMMKKEEKRRREADWKQRARNNYRKK